MCNEWNKLNRTKAFHHVNRYQSSSHMFWYFSLYNAPYYFFNYCVSETQISWNSNFAFQHFLEANGPIELILESCVFFIYPDAQEKFFPSELIPRIAALPVNLFFPSGRLIEKAVADSMESIPSVILYWNLTPMWCHLRSPCGAYLSYTIGKPLMREKTYPACYANATASSQISAAFTSACKP